MKTRTDRALSDKTLPGNVAVRPARPNVSINVFDDCPGPAGPPNPAAKKAAFPAACNKVAAATTSQAAGGRCRFCPRESSLSLRRARRVKPVDRNQLSSRDRAVWAVSRESLLSFRYLFLSPSLSPLSRPSLISSYLNAELHCATCLS